MIYFDTKTTKNPMVNSRWDALCNARKDFINGDQRFNNGVNIIPPDVFTEIDRRTVSMLTDPTADVLYRDLLSVAVPVSTGTLIQSYRQTDTDEAVNVSMMGNKKPVGVNAVESYQSDIIPVHDSGFSIGWREREAMQRGDWNVLLDQNDAAVRSVRNSIQAHAIGTRVYEHAGIPTRGLLTDTDRVQQIKAPVDFSSEKTTGKAIKDGFAKVLTEAQTKSFILTPRVAYVSPDIYANLYRDYSDTIDKTIFEKVMNLPLVSEIKQTTALTGNQILLGVLSTEHIQLLTAQEIATQPILRVRPTDDYEFSVMGICGTQIRTDAAGHTAWAKVS